MPSQNTNTLELALTIARRHNCGEAQALHVATRLVALRDGGASAGDAAKTLAKELLIRLDDAARLAENAYAPAPPDVPVLTVNGVTKALMKLRGTPMDLAITQATKIVAKQQARLRSDAPSPASVGFSARDLAKKLMRDNEGRLTLEAAQRVAQRTALGKKGSR